MKKSSIKLGNIPKKLKFYCRAESEFKFRWDDIEVDEETRVTRGHEAFAVDAENTKTHKTAETWAEGYRYYHREDKPEKTWFIDEYDNEPIEGLVLIGLEHRGNGGRAYKVKVKDKYVFDLREDVLLDILLNDQVTMGLIPGKFIFAKVGAEMKLIRVGSLLHSKMIEATDYWKEDVISKFEIGGVYQNKTTTMIYLGKVHFDVYHTEWQKTAHGWRNTLTEDHTKPPKSVTKVGERYTHAFFKWDPNYSSLDDDKFWYAYPLTTYDKLPKSFRRKINQFDSATILDTIKEKVLAQRLADNRNKQDPMLYLHYDLTHDLGILLNLSYTKGYVHPFYKEHMLHDKTA